MNTNILEQIKQFIKGKFVWPYNEHEIELNWAIGRKYLLFFFYYIW